MWLYCRNDLFLKDLFAHGCNRLLLGEKRIDNLWSLRNFLNDQSPVLAQLGFHMCSGVVSHETLLKEEVKQRPVEKKNSTTGMENCVFTTSVTSILSSVVSVDMV